MRGQHQLARIEFVASHHSLAMKNSHAYRKFLVFPECDVDHGETARILLILQPLKFGGNRTSAVASNAKNAFLILPHRTYRFLREAIMSQRSRPQPAGIGVRKMVSFKTVSEKLNAWRRYRAAVRELSQLSDHELSDIGIGRGEIEAVARRPVARKAAV